MFWDDSDSRAIDKTDYLDDIHGDCNKETYIQRVVLLEQGAWRNPGFLTKSALFDLRKMTLLAAKDPLQPTCDLK